MNLVSLPMYDWPEVRALNDSFYEGLRPHLENAGFFAPDKLTRSADPMTEWQSVDLLLSQTCGLPYVSHLRNSVKLIGTPDFELPGCKSGCYSSAIIVRDDSAVSTFAELAQARAVINGPDSQSGCAALYQLVLRVGGVAPYFGEVMVSGSHRASAASVASGDADVCAIDPVSWHLLQAWDRDVSGRLRVLDWSDLVPALPLITSNSLDDARFSALQNAVQTAFGDPALASARQALNLNGLVFFNDADYDQIAEGWATLQRNKLVV